MLLEGKEIQLCSVCGKWKKRLSREDWENEENEVMDLFDILRIKK